MTTGVNATAALAYAGLPPVAEFGKVGRTISFDIVAERVAKCRAGTDPLSEFPDVEMALAQHAECYAGRSNIDSR